MSIIHRKTILVVSVFLAAFLVQAWAEDPRDAGTNVVVSAPAGLETGLLRPPNGTCPHPAQVCALLADPAIENVVRLTDKARDATLLAANSAGALPPSCAVRDLAVFTLIEKHGEAETMRAQILTAMFFELLTARRACREGRTNDALTIYDRVAAELTGGNH